MQAKSKIHPDVKKALRRTNRKENMQYVLDALDPNQHNFNSLLLSFVDVIQSTFYEYIRTQCKNEHERRQMHDRINEEVNEVMEVLNANSLSNPEDMVVLATVMVECIYKALIHQGNNEKDNPIHYQLGAKK